MFNEETVEDSADLSTQEANTETYENDSTGEGESETTTKEAVERKPETAEQRVARLKRQLEREERKLGIEGKDSPKESSKESVEVKDSYVEKYNRLALKTEGITDRKEQDIVLDYADYKGIDVEEALKSTVIKAELKEYRDKKSTPAPSTRTSKGGTTSIDSLVSKYKAGKYLSPDEMKQVRQKLRG